MGDRYIVEREFEHSGYKCVVTFGVGGYRCGYVGIPKSHPLYGKNYSDYLEIKKEDLKNRKISGVFSLLCACLDKDERIRIEAYFQCHGGITFADGGENSNYPIGSDLWWFGLTADIVMTHGNLNLLIRDFRSTRQVLQCRLNLKKYITLTAWQSVQKTMWQQSVRS